MTTDYRAAWVPDDDPHRPWEDAAAAAAGWARMQASELQREPLLVTFSRQTAEGMDAFVGFEQVTMRSPGSVTGTVGRPTVAFAPEERVLALAHRYARNAALAVVESKSFPLHGWAREAEAVNLLDGTTLDPLEPDVRELLERLAFAGNNGWFDQSGKRDAGRLLAELRGRVDVAEVLGFVLAHKASGRSASNLRKIAEKTSL